MKQIDRIRNMNAEELAWFLRQLIFLPREQKCEKYCACKNKLRNCFDTTCCGGIKEWLESEVEE